MYMRVALCLGLMCLYAGSIEAAKMYKIVDEQGNVTYSQFPPPPKPAQEQDGLTVDEVSVNGASASRVRTLGRKQYCGEIQLPTINPKKPEEYLDLGELRQAWLNELEGDTDLNNVRFRMYMGRYDVNRNPSEAGQRKRDLQCAIEWVDKQKGDVEKARASLQQEVTELNQQIARIKSRREKQCGSEPYRNPNQPSTQAIWQRWSDCYYQYQDELYDLEYKVSEIPLD